VSEFVRPFNRDARDFIWEAADLVHKASIQGETGKQLPKNPKRVRGKGLQAPRPVEIPVPPTISHFVMNLPASAITFVRHYKAVYAGKEALFVPHTDVPLPMVHVHCFSEKVDNVGQEAVDADICQRLFDEIGVRLQPGDPQVQNQVGIRWVRAVAPKKAMYCASFRIPPEVAFAPRTSTS
jgi:tRNA (guanine37-N1)-methyltransferase